MVAVDDQADAAVLGRRRSAMSSSAMIFMREIDAGGHPPRHRGDVLQHAVDAEAHAQLAPVGREVDVGGAALDGLGDDLVDELDDRRVVGGLVQRRRPRRRRPRRSLVLGAVADDVVEAVEARDQRGDVVAAARPRRGPRSRS